MPSYLAGKTGWFKSGNSSYTMREWRLEMEAAECDVSNFTSSGYSEFITGLVSSRITANGPLDAALQFTIGSAMNLNLGLGNNYYTAINSVLTRVAPSTAVDQAAKVELSFRTNGTFTTTFNT